MGLHDIDKKTGGRIAPSPNTNDNLAQRMSHNTNSTSYRTDADENKQRIAFKNNLILTYDAEDRVSSVYGYIPELADEPVLIIAEAGYDVFTDILGLTAPTV